MQYRREVDGLRAVAVVPVILWHAGFIWTSGGFAGVDIFFVISGFLIASILFEELTAGRYSIMRFYERRARRILPALFFVIAASYPFAWAWMRPEAFAGYSNSIAAATFFVSNFYFWLSTDYFSIADQQLPLLHTWSLAVEEQFYLAFPLLLLGLWKIAPRRILPILILAALASLGLSEWGWRNAHEANFYLAPTRAWELLAGAAAAIYCHQRASEPVQSLSGQMLSCLGLAMMLASFFVYDEFTPFPSVYGLLPVTGAVLVLIHGRTGTAAAALLSWRPVVGIGLISYSAYLWHQVIFALVRIRLLEPPSTLMMAFLCVLSLGLAAISWRYVEHPFRQRGGTAVVSTPRLAGLVAGGALIFAALSAFGVMTDGAGFRFAANTNAISDQIAAAKSDRNKVTRVATCQFNSMDSGANLGQFLKNWSCMPQSADHLAASRIAIFGDSHSSDIAAAMRLNGHDVLQVAGANCPLNPEYMLPDCRRIADFAKERLIDGHMTELWLVNRFDNPRDLTRPALEGVLAFWKIDGVKLTLFSPMPEFHDMKNRLIKMGWHGQNLSLPRDMAVADAFLSPENRALFDASSVRVLDTGAIFCAAMTHCGPLDGETLLMIDGHHLSVEGARRFGAVLVRQVFRQ